MATTELGVLQLSGTKKGKISISNVSEPYGKGTPDIISIGISLNGKDIEWKSHIPYENLDDVIAILQEASQKKRGRRVKLFYSKTTSLPSCNHKAIPPIRWATFLYP